MQQKPLFVPQDLQRIEQLVFNNSLEPRFNALSGYLVWDDELPDVTPDGLDVLQTLLTARSLLHRGLTLADHPINVEYSTRVWEQAMKEIPNWPGFRRLMLSQAEEAFFDQKLNHSW